MVERGGVCVVERAGEPCCNATSLGPTISPSQANRHGRGEGEGGRGDGGGGERVGESAAASGGVSRLPSIELAGPGSSSARYRISQARIDMSTDGDSIVSILDMSTDRRACDSIASKLDMSTNVNIPG